MIGRCLENIIGLGAVVSLGIAVMFLNIRTGAAETSWQDESYPYVVVESDLRSVMEDFSRNTGVPVHMSDSVRGDIRGEIPALTAKLFLDRMAREYDLVWYYDGFVVDISTSSELRTEVMDATGVSVARLENEMEALNILEPRFDIRGSEQTGLIFVSGPPRYVELVQQTLGRMRDIAARPVQVLRGSSQTSLLSDLNKSAGDFK